MERESGLHRLLEYELWARVHARGLTRSNDEQVRGLLGRIAFVELARPALERALEPIAKPVRTLDVLHLASMDFLRRNGQSLTLASYDVRLIAAARQLKFAVMKL